MLPRLQTFWLQKEGNASTEYEDAFWCPTSLPHDWKTFRVAIADGATETSFSREWAKLLARSYGRNRLAHDLGPAALSRPRQFWQRLVARRSLPWYAEAKAEMGAYSSLLGITVSRNGASGTWEAIAVGDSCLFQVRGDDLLEAFPLVTSESFTSRPALLGSVADAALENSAMHTRAGLWQPGDVFYLMTDALACWFLKRRECQDDPLLCLRHLQTQEDFQQFIARQRQITSDEDKCCHLKNDDVTLITCEMPDESGSMVLS